ncbi:MAG: glycosyltransferase, partial [Candidatus Bathyarchaeota archaeon]|nr:glycosyltransferase [Candidatus Bathyarchaeota archaeon]
LVKKDVPDVELYITAGGPHLPIVLKKAEKLNVLKNIRMTGWLPFSQLISMLPNFAVGVSPSRNKLLNSLIIPRKVFEYMAAGVPVVASRLEAMNEIITHRETGMLVEPEDPQALAEALVALLTDNTLSRRIKQRARKAIENHDASVQKKMSELFSSRGKD